LTLVSVAPLPEQTAAGTINFRSDGEISFLASGQAGTALIEYTVQDELGMESADKGVLEISVSDEDNLAPTPHADRVELTVGEETQVDLLENDLDPDDDPLSLSDVLPHEGVTIVDRGADGTVTLLANE